VEFCTSIAPPSQSPQTLAVSLINDTEKTNRK
jgi:hypothetical protein